MQTSALQTKKYKTLSGREIQTIKSLTQHAHTTEEELFEHLQKFTNLMKENQEAKEKREEITNILKEVIEYFQREFEKVQTKEGISKFRLASTVFQEWWYAEYNKLYERIKPYFPEIERGKKVIDGAGKSPQLGIFSGEQLRDWFDQQIVARTKLPPNVTFQELQEYAKQHSDMHIKELYIVGSNLMTGREEIFSHEETPHMVIADAIRISMSIPFVFKPHQRYDKDSPEKKPEPYRHRKEKDGESYLYDPDFYIDGGLITNYPLRIFDKLKYVPNIGPDALNSSVEVFNQSTLGFKLISQPVFEDLLNQKTPVTYRDIDTPTDFIRAVLNCYFAKQDNDHYNSNDKQRTVYIRDTDVHTIEFDLSNASRSNLYGAGREQTKDFFDRLKEKDNEFKGQPSEALIVGLTHCSSSKDVSFNSPTFQIFLRPNITTVEQVLTLCASVKIPKDLIFLQRMKLRVNEIKNVSDESTALHIATEQGKFNVVEILLKLKANGALINKAGNTPLDLAIEKYQASAVSSEKSNYGKIISLFIENNFMYCTESHRVSINEYLRITSSSLHEKFNRIEATPPSSPSASC